MEAAWGSEATAKRMVCENIYRLAAKEINLGDCNMGKGYITGFPYYRNLVLVP